MKSQRGERQTNFWRNNGWTFSKFIENCKCLELRTYRNTKKMIQRQSVIKLIKTSDKQKTLKAIREKSVYKGTKKRIIVNFLLQTRQEEKKQEQHFSCIEKKNVCLSRTQYLVTMSFKNESKMKTFLVVQTLKEFMYFLRRWVKLINLYISQGKGKYKLPLSEKREEISLETSQISKWYYIHKFMPINSATRTQWTNSCKHTDHQPSRKKS